MAEWTNIFLLSDWDVYVKYVGVTSLPTPDSFTLLVRASELDPQVGTVHVTPGGLIVCDFENLSGTGGEAPTIVVMPIGAGVAGRARLTCSAVEGLLGGVQSSELIEVISVESSGPDTFTRTNSNNNYVEYASSGDWASATELPSEIAQGSGLGFSRYGAGF